MSEKIVAINVFSYITTTNAFQDMLIGPPNRHTPMVLVLLEQSSPSLDILVGIKVMDKYVT